MVLLLKYVDLHAALGVGAVLGGVNVDAGVRPSLDEEVAVEVKILEAFVVAEPGREIGAGVNDDFAVVDVECGFGTFFDGPAVESLAVEDRFCIVFGGEKGWCE